MANGARDPGGHSKSHFFTTQNHPIQMTVGVSGRTRAQTSSWASDDQHWNCLLHSSGPAAVESRMTWSVLCTKPGNSSTMLLAIKCLAEPESKITSESVGSSGIPWVTGAALISSAV